MFLSILTLIGALGMFLYGMNMMSSGLQKAAGDGLRRFVASMTSNPLKGVTTGLGVTAVIQSSSATTVMVVSFVNAGILTLTQAIGVIMGANIGTTFTAWIIALFGFSADISILAVPLMAIGFVMSLSKKGKTRDISEIIVGFSLLFLGLSFMKNSVPNLETNPEVLSFIQSWGGHGVWSVLLFILVGTTLTLVLQSSSATVALTLVFLNMGWIQFDMAAAMVLGENIGTTITANIAAAVGNTNAKRAALAHTVFNVFGVIWAVCFFRYFLALIQWIWVGWRRKHLPFFQDRHCIRRPLVNSVNQANWLHDRIFHVSKHILGFIRCKLELFCIEIEKCTSEFFDEQLTELIKLW